MWRQAAEASSFPTIDEVLGCSNHRPNMGGQQPGPMCEVEIPWCTDQGTNSRGGASRPGLVYDDQWALDQALLELETEATNFGTRMIRDSFVRRQYFDEIRRMSEDLLERVRGGRITPGAAAEEANTLRNSIMEASRLRSSDIGRAAAESLKSTGRTLAELQEQYARQLFRRTFAQLSAAERDQVFLSIVRSSGRSNPIVNARNLRWGRLGRGLIVLTVALAVYNIATAEDPVEATAHEGVTLGGGIAGGAAAGAVAGLACGPGAPVCVGVFVFVGGALGAFGADFGYSWLRSR